MMGWNMGWGGGMFFGGFLSLLILVGVVVLAVGLLRNTGSSSGSGSTPSAYGERGGGQDEPLRILQTRYANGEINQEEYETKRRDLRTISGSGN